MLIKDRIKNMTDDELASFLAWLIDSENRELFNYMSDWINGDWSLGHEKGISEIININNKEVA